MAYIKLIDQAEAEGVLRRQYEGAEQRAGYVANIIKVMSQDVESLRASIQLYISLMKSDNALNTARREMLATVVSNANGCFY